MAKKKTIRRIRRQGPASAGGIETAQRNPRESAEGISAARPAALQPATTGIAARIRAAREAQGLTWYAVAKRAGIPNPSTVRDIEYGRDTKLSSVEAVAESLGLQLKLVEV